MKSPTRPRRKPANSLTPNPWPEAMATVIACKYDFAAGRALAFGLPTSKHFRITFNYWANGDLHTSEFTSETYLPQGHLFPIRYNPTQPHQHDRTNTTHRANPLITIGIIGSIVLSFAWFLILHSCH